MKKLILIPGLILTLLISQVANAEFSDVNQGTNYMPSITWMSDNGVIQGYPDGTFKPDQCVNRAEFLKMMYLTSKKDIITTDSAAGSHYYDNFFSDTSTSEWYWPYVNKALQDGTVEGYPDGTFKPAQCVNRVEAIKMAVLEFNNGKIPSYEEGLWNVSDVDRSEWYGQYFVPAFFNNLIGRKHIVQTSVESFNFLPGDSMSRKEVAEMLIRMKTVKDNLLTVYEEGDTPEPLNFYVSPTSGVSFMMTDGWEVTSDDYYETPGGAVSDYPTIQMQGPNNEIVAINMPMMQCEGEMAVNCYELAEGYTIGTGNPSTEAMFLINRILLTFRVTEVEFIAFDGCGMPSDYTTGTWWPDFVNSWDAYLLTLPGTVPNHEALSNQVGDYCLALNKSVFMFIPDYYEDSSARVFKYDIVNDTVKMAQTNGAYNPKEFGARTDDYIPLIGIHDYYGCEYIAGNYYYLENEVDTNVATTCSN